MKDRLAFSTNAFSNENYTVDQAINIIGECGYSGVEILFDKPHVWPLDLDASRIAELQTAVAATGMAISNINGNTASGFYGDRNAPPGQTFGPGFSCTEDEFKEWGIDPAAYRVDFTKRCIEAAQQLGAGNVSVSSGFVGPGQDADRLWDQAVECFKECTEYAGNAGLHLIIEYEPDMLIGSAADCMRMIDAVGSDWLGVNYDMGHSYVVPGEDVFEAIELLGDRIIGTHVEDIAGPTPELHIDPGHLIPGDGKMPLREIFEKLEHANYKGYYTVELYTYARPGKDPMYAVTESLKRLMELAPD